MNTMRRLNILISLFFAAAIIFAALSGQTVLAQGAGSTGGGTGNTTGGTGQTGAENITLTNPLCTGGQANCQNSTATGLIKNIVGWIFTLATPIAVGMIIVGALQMVTAAGSEDKFSTGKRTVLYAVIGYAIILIGWGITSIIQSLLSQ